MKRIVLTIVTGVLSLIPSVIWGQNIEYVGSTSWSIANDIDVVGNYAYCAFVNGLEIIDISNPISPAVISRLFLDGQGQQIQVAGQYAYITDGTAGLRVVDISNSTDPVLVGTCDTPVFAGKFAISGNIVFVADSSSDLQIIDISNPVDPFMAGTYNEGDTINTTIAVEGNIACVGCYYHASILDITEPVHPIHINRVNIGDAVDLYISQGRLLSITSDVPNPGNVNDTGSVFIVWDISDPYDPELLAGDFSPIRAVKDLKAVGNIAYIMSDWYFMVIEGFNQRNPPPSVHHLQVRGSGISIQDSMAYTIGESFLGGSFLTTIDIARPESLIILNSYYLGNHAYDVTVNGNYAYIPGLGIVDVSDPTSPYEVGRLEGRFIQSIIISENCAFVGYYHAGVDIYDISDPTNPIYLSYIPMISHGRAMTVSGNYFYVATIAGIYIYDISDIQNPILAGQYQQSGPDWDIVISGHYLLAAAHDQLLAIDVSDPHQPTLVNSYPAGDSYLRRISVSGNHAYVTGQNGIRIFDISNLPALTLIGQYETDYDLNSITAEANYVLAVGIYQDDIAKLLVLDISNPSDPSLVTSIDLPYGFSEVTSANGYIYIANKSAMLIFRLYPTKIEEGNNLPLFTSLSQNFPNPFNATTTIQYDLPKSANVSLEIFDILGRKIETLVEGTMPAGEHKAIWDASGQASGLYFYRIKAGEFAETKKMVLLR